MSPPEWTTSGLPKRSARILQGWTTVHCSLFRVYCSEFPIPFPLLLSFSLFPSLFVSLSLSCILFFLSSLFLDKQTRGVSPSQKKVDGVFHGLHGLQHRLRELSPRPPWSRNRLGFTSRSTPSAAYASALSPSFLDKKDRVTKSVNGLCAATTVALESSLSITCATLNTGWMQRLRIHLVRRLCTTAVFGE